MKTCGACGNPASTWSPEVGSICNDCIAAGIFKRCDICGTYDLATIMESTVDGKSICTACQSKLEQCEECGCFADSLVSAGDKSVCEECREVHFTICNDCGALEHNSNRILVDGNYFICQECYEDDYFSCGRCGHVTHSDDIVVVHDRRYEETWCQSCADSYAIECEDCHAVVTANNSWRGYCDSCAEHYFCCEECGEVHHNDDSYYTEDDEGPFCENCYDSNKRTIIRNYSYKPSPRFNGLGYYGSTKGKLFLGVELEMEAGNYDRNYVAERLRDYDEDEELFYLKQDGSLSNGIELVTHPCTLKFHREEFEWAELLKTAVNNGMRSHDTKTCGIHVHLSRKFFTRSEQTRFVAFVNVHSEHLIKLARRRECDYTKFKHKSMGCKKLVVQAERYEAVNQYNNSTLEVRIFKGTLKLHTLMACIEVCDAMAHFVKTCSIAEIIQQTDNNWISFLEFISGKPEYQELVEYFVARNMMTVAPSTGIADNIQFCDYWKPETSFAA